MKEVPTCKYCGSKDVLADAYAQWNEEKDEWEIANVFDEKGAFCPECDGETAIKWREK
jgi:ssDNA-binding Zn-finger/Zn-ribbon topoisomerase 1